jgi:hypothetical protein
VAQVHNQLPLLDDVKILFYGHEDINNDDELQYLLPCVMGSFFLVGINRKSIPFLKHDSIKPAIHHFIRFTHLFCIHSQCIQNSYFLIQDHHDAG